MRQSLQQLTFLKTARTDLITQGASAFLSERHIHLETELPVLVL